LESSTKFWKCVLKGTTTTMVFGNIGTPGQNRVKVHTSVEAAEKYMNKMADGKKKEGYAAKGRQGTTAPKAADKTSARSAAKAAPKAVGAKRKAEPARSSSAPPAKARKGAGGGRIVDTRCPKTGLKVIEDYTIKLNQTNVGANNNKFYVIQALEGGGGYFAWNRWGRVGDDGMNKLQPCGTKEAAVKEFTKKFMEKTSNQWASRDSFVKKAGKYTIVETEESGGGDQAPMGKLTEAQIGKGQAVLDKLSTVLKRGGPQVEEFSSQFYSLIPHNFGWKKPVAITTNDMLSEKQELLKFYLRMGFEKVEVDSGVSPIDGVMSLPLPKSLEDAAKGICGSGSITSSNKQGKELAAKQAGRPKAKMDASLYASIMLYTSNAIYSALNKALRDKDRGKIKKYFKYLRLLLEAMKTLPQQKKTLWRGISVDLISDPSYAPGKTITWWGVSSCTSDVGVARGFAAGCGGGCSVLTINSKSACDIQAISFFGSEKESLLPPGTQFKVKSRAKKSGVTEITLEELGCAIG